MKNSKLRRALLLLASAVLLVSLSVGATLAYLTSTTEVVQNTFTVGNVAIILDEAKVDEYGNPLKGTTGEDGNTTYAIVENVNDADRVMSNTYKLLPGHVYPKDPTVTVNEGSEVAYVRMLVKISHIDQLEAICGDPFKPVDVVNGWDAAKWLYQGNAVIDNVGYYEFWYYQTVDARADAVVLPDLFTEIKVPGTATNAQIEALDDMVIDVIAQAVQADGFNTAALAWAQIDRPTGWDFTPVQ